MYRVNTSEQTVVKTIAVLIKTINMFFSSEAARVDCSFEGIYNKRKIEIASVGLNNESSLRYIGWFWV